MDSETKPSAPINELYPTLPTVDHSYKINHIEKLRQRLEQEHETRRALYKSDQLT